jgi:ubiquinone/menaquinone biosynthesis C-methylase UbiE
MLSHEYDTMRQVEDTYWWYRVLRKLTAGAVARHIPPSSSASILDAGTGTGGMLDELRRTSATWKLHGFDFSPLAVEHTQKRGFPDVKHGSINAIPEPDAAFDAVTSLDVTCCKGVDIPQAFREFKRVLKPGGIVVQNFPAFEALKGRHDIAVYCVRRFTVADVRRLHEEQGLELLSVHYWNAWLFLPILAWRQITRVTARSENQEEVASDLSPLPSLLNGLLYRAGMLDASLCRLLGPPFGTSVFSVARKPIPS